jgi:Na+/H+-dicarboxylate symporter
MKLHVAIAIGLAAGLLFGLLAALSGLPALIAVAESIEPIGTAFVNLLKMVVVPLVAAVIYVGVARLGDLRQLGKLGGFTLLFFAATTVVSILIGMGVMAALLPLASDAAARAVEAAATDAPMLPGPVDFLVSLIPSNAFAAAAEGALLPLVVFTVLMGAATGALTKEHKERLVPLAESISAALVKLVHWILWVAPIGVFALAAPVTARAGLAIIQSLFAFVLAVLLGLVLFVAAVYVPLVRFVGRMPVRTFLRGSLTPQLIGAGATSSAATVPAMLETAQKDWELSPVVSGFVISLGAGLGRAGSALFQGAGIVFLAWLYGVSLPIAGIAGALLATFVVSFTVAGVPGGSVVSLAPALGTLGIPLDGMAILLGVDRIPDMARTATNVTGTLAATVVVERSVRKQEWFHSTGPLRVGSKEEAQWTR